MSWRWLLALVFCVSTAALAEEGQAEREIDYLLDYVAVSGCSFHRNGEDHASPEAADHLRMKYRRGKRYAPSAEAFIDRLASQSSWSGKPYTVTCGERTLPSASWLHRALADYRAATD